MVREQVTTPRTPTFVFEDVTRITVVVDQPDGLVFEKYNAYSNGIELHLQDDGRTLKIFPRRP